jgi:hypothetical protein
MDPPAPDPMAQQLYHWSRLEREALDAEDELQHLRLMGERDLDAAQQKAQLKRETADRFLNELLVASDGRLKVNFGSRPGADDKSRS